MAGSGGMVSTAGSGGAAGGSSAGAGGAGKCPGNQISKDGGPCMCPTYAPLYCDAITKCVSSMKDPDHCGGCDTKCTAMQACAAGACTPDLASFAEITGCGALELVSAPGKLYALSTMTGTLSSIALPAGGAATSVATGLTGGTAFTVDTMNAYVTTGMTLTRVNLTSGMKETVVTETAQIFDVAVDQGKLFYATGKDIKMVDATATAGTGVSVAVSADEGEAQGVAVSGANVVYASNAAFNLETDPIVGEGHVKIGASQSGLLFGHRSVQADATTAYWVNMGLQSALVGGTNHAATTVAVPIEGKDIIAYAVDPAKTMAYIATKDGSFEKSKFSDGASAMEATWVARALPKVSSIVLDDTSVYLASECKILKSPR
jgi:hypothetical protein